MSESLSHSELAQLRRAMRAVGTAGFFDAYRAVFRSRTDFAALLMMRFDPGQPPILLDHYLDARMRCACAPDDYAGKAHAFDPLCLCRDVPADGAVFRLSEVAPDRFFSSEYHLQHYRRRGLCDAVGFLAPLQTGGLAHLSLLRRNAQGRFRRRELRFLRHFSPVLLELLQQHCTALAPARADQPAAPLPPLSDQIQAYATQSLRIPVTRREAQIAALILQGHSNASAALMLDIATGTCKVHRRNLYGKLGISSQHELFGLFSQLP